MDQTSIATGYQFRLPCFWLLSAGRAVDRVPSRVQEGSHAVPEESSGGGMIQPAELLPSLPSVGGGRTILRQLHDTGNGDWLPAAICSQLRWS